MIQTAGFDRCPPIAWGVCMLDRGYPTAMCALSATCCVNAPVPRVETARDTVLGQSGLDQRRTAALTRWKREKAELAA